MKRLLIYGILTVVLATISVLLLIVNQIPDDNKDKAGMLADLKGMTERLKGLVEQL